MPVLTRLSLDLLSRLRRGGTWEAEVVRASLEVTSPEARGSHVQGTRHTELVSRESKWPCLVGSGRPGSPLLDSCD